MCSGSRGGGGGGGGFVGGGDRVRWFVICVNFIYFLCLRVSEINDSSSNYLFKIFNNAN